ncbi:MAG: sarcosine oxidase subunit gamma family protein [Alphaproteobacteria bacterium]|nr:sarcosine oxidase subunit gamma family protein [Alphaproteobacteria bacterium]
MAKASSLYPGITIDTPLSGRNPIQADGLVVTELPFLGKITLRGDAADPAFAAAVKSVLGTDLPTQPMTSQRVGNTRVFWKAFDEWLIWTPEDAEQKLGADLNAALTGLRKSVVDVSDYYTILRIDGPRSRDLLAKGCVIDLHPRAFHPGQATGTGFHHATIFITQTDSDVFDIMVRWSFADYLWNYFADGAREWAA